MTTTAEPTTTQQMYRFTAAGRAAYPHLADKTFQVLYRDQYPRLVVPRAEVTEWPNGTLALVPPGDSRQRMRDAGWNPDEYHVSGPLSDTFVEPVPEPEPAVLTVEQRLAAMPQYRIAVTDTTPPSHTVTAQFLGTEQSYAGIAWEASGEGRVTILVPDSPRARAAGMYRATSRTATDRIRVAGFLPEEVVQWSFVSSDAVPVTEPAQPETTAQKLARLPQYRVTSQGRATAREWEYLRDRTFAGLRESSGRVTLAVPYDEPGPMTWSRGTGNLTSREVLLSVGINFEDVRVYRTYANQTWERLDPLFPQALVDAVTGDTVTEDPHQGMSKKELRAALAAAKAAHEEDIRKIADGFHAQADSRGLCSDYDAAVAKVNRDLTVKIGPRRRRVTRTITADVTYQRSGNIAVYDDATPEELEAAMLAYARANFHSTANVSNVRVTS